MKALTALRLLLVGAVCVLVPGVSAAGADDSVARAERATESVIGLDFDDAHKELAGGDPSSPAIALAEGRLALYEARCDRAVELFGRADLAHDEAAAGLLDIARGCARITAATVHDAELDPTVDVRYQDENDKPLTALIVATVVRAREALTRDLGVTWPKPTRVVVVRDLLSLSAMTGLPYEAAQTTGTVAVAKWGRVTLLSPRASRHGYAWRDTIAHELTHLAVTRATLDRAPLWLQEGVAKREEVRWRPPGPFDDRPTPEALVVRGIEQKLDLPLDKLGPSIAMLPSAEAAMVAFAEVTSFVRYFADSGGDDALPRLLGALRAQKSPDEALLAVSGADLKGWDGRWRAELAAHPPADDPAVDARLGTSAKALLGAALASKADAGAGAGNGTGPKASERELRDAREKVRVAELLAGRGHPTEALAEVDAASRLDARDTVGDPSLRSLHGRILEQLGRADEAWPDVADAHAVTQSYAPWWALRGRLVSAHVPSSLAATPTPDADAAYVEAIAADPFDAPSACETVDPAASPAPARDDPAARALCAAARGTGEPLLGRD
jgi:hypothetical protein